MSGPPSHRHTVMNAGTAKMASAYAPELVNTVLPSTATADDE